MSVVSKERKVTPHWIMKIFGVEGGSILISESGVVIRKENQETLIRVLTLLRNTKVSQGLFFSKIEFHQDGEAISFDGIPNLVAQQAYDWLKKSWYQINHASVAMLAAKIKKAFTGRYLRTSQWNILKEEVLDAVLLFVEPPGEGVLDDSEREQFIYLYDVSLMDEGGIERVRKQYIKRCEQNFDDYFSGVESNPLTSDQRHACIVDEDNNLVLAGAGTGKTSTMVGRAGFLLESQQAEGSDILMLAFAKKAAEEMQERIEEKIGDNDITVSTFHKLGKEIVTSVEGESPGVTVFAEDRRLLAKQIKDWLNELLEQDSYRRKVLEYFENYLYVEENPFDFDTEGGYYAHLENNDIRTLKGEKVKGYGERVIANHLFKMGVEYQYEPNYEHSTRGLDFRQYKPDFYLPEYGIYIEHFGVSRDGGTAPYVNQEQYHASMEWKRELHRSKQTILVETYHYEHAEMVLRESLSRRLIEKNVEFNPLPDEAVLETLRNFGEITNLTVLMTDLLDQYKANWFEADRLEQKIEESSYGDHIRAALDLLSPILENYQEVLDSQLEIDFNDMIGKALDYVESGEYVPAWRYIMVDEFQDISDPRARLVRALKDGVSDCSLFCVGDDWQAIYRFAGSDINFTTGFSEFFGSTKRTVLHKTFRYNNSIAEVSSSFVCENSSQTQRKMQTSKKVSHPAISILRQAKYINPGEMKPIERILEKISGFEESDSSVLVLGRYRHTLPELAELNVYKEQFPNLTVKRQTAHGAKGKEADYVVVLGLESGKWGFPSEKTTNPLLDALLPNKEEFLFAEERRLFYVALTRARKRVYLVTDMTIASRFVKELIEGDYKIELGEFDVAYSQESYQKIHCILCETGTLQPRHGAHGDFYGCSHYPLCKHTENGCNACGQPMSRKNIHGVGKYKVCINPECDSWTPLCPNCGAELVQRVNRRDDSVFWGCRNWRPGNQRSCSYTINQVVAPALNQQVV